jgi:hypothetical protein
MKWCGLSKYGVIAVLAVAPPASAESLLDKLLRVSGLTASPAQMRPADDTVEAGNIWVADLDRRTARAITTGGGYRSPIFAPVTGGLYALNGDAIVRISLETGAAAAIQRVPAVIKLVGFDSSNDDEIVVLRDAGSDASPLGVVSLKTRGIRPLFYDAKNQAERGALGQIRGQDRDYGDTVVYVQTVTKQGLARTVGWTDIFVRRGTGAPQNVSACNGTSCGQPALSSDGRSLAFVKAEDH